MVTRIDCDQQTTGEINRKLAALEDDAEVVLTAPGGRHNLAVSLVKPIHVVAEGHVGYYHGGMNKNACITIEGNAGAGVGENMMSGFLRVKGHASAAAGASAHGGLLVVEKNASVRCGISLKGADIVVGGNVGNMCGFLAQAGTIVICGNAAHSLGDSLYEAVIYIRGEIQSLGADAREETMQPADYARVRDLLDRADMDFDPKAFKRVASARTLYHFDTNQKQTY